MKKKLIAIVTSLAMVATMVPATTFAAATPKADPTMADDEIVKFLNEAKDIPNKINSYDKLTDMEVVEAVDAYAALTTAQGTLVKGDETSAGGKATYDSFKKSVQDQWAARIAAIDDAVADVTPKVYKENSDTTSIQTVQNLKGLFGRFFPTNYNTTDKMYLVLGADDAPVATDKANGLGLATLQTQIAAKATAAGTANGEATAAEPVVLGIAALPAVTANNYDDVLTTIGNGTNDGKLKKQYADLVDASNERVGNANELTQKETAANAYAAEVTAVNNAINATPFDGDPSDDTLTAATINAYRVAYETVKKNYDELSDTQKGNVADRADLTTIAANIANYDKGVAKEQAVTAAIGNLPAGTNPADALEIAKAKVAFNALSSNAAGTYADLATGFRANINETAQARLERAVSLLNACVKTDDEVAAAVAPVKQLIAALPNTVTAADIEAVETANEAYNAILNASVITDSTVRANMTAALRDDKKVLDAAVKAMNGIVSDNTEAIEKFTAAVDAVTGSGADINSATYRNLTKEARAAYDKLDDGQKAMVAADNPAGAKAKYDALIEAEENVAAAAKLDEVAALIKAVPNAATLKLDDPEQVKKVKDAQDAYEALTADAVTLLRNPAQKYVTAKEMDNYDSAVKKVTEAENKTASTAVIEAIKALPTLPKEFTSTSEVDTAKAPLEAAEKAYKELTKEQQAAVTNYADLTKYRTAYDTMLKAYADAVYAEAAKIDLEAELTAESIALIKNLKTLVADEYIATGNIKDFDQKVYDALIAALGNEHALENATIAAIDAVTYDGTAKTPAVTVTDKAGTVIADTEYDVRYSNNTNAGTATVIVSAKSGSTYTGSITADFTIEKADIQTAAKAGAIAKQTYNKKAKTPAVTVTTGDKKLINGSDYTVTYANNTNIGQAKATITGTGNYKGTITTTFIIAPAKGTITSLKAGKKQFTVSYEAQKATSGKTGYRIVYSPAKGQAKAVQTTAVKKTVKSLKSGKTYKVKVRAYKTINGTKYNGAYSAVKKVKVK